MENNASHNSDCIVLTTTYRDIKLLVVFLSSLVLGIILFILFLVLRFLLWEFGKQNIYHWGRDNNVDNYADNPTRSGNNNIRYVVAREHSLFNWIRNYASYGLKNFRERVGTDAYLYQVFQLHLVLLMSCYVIICVVVILTVNVAYCSQDIPKISTIVTTTVSACLSCDKSGNTKYDILWLHSIMTHALVVIGFLIGLNYRRILYSYEDKNRFKYNALQICHLPSPQSQEETEELKESIRKHFFQTEKEEEAPTTIDFVYDVATYDSLRNRLIEAEKSFETYQSLEEKYGVEQDIYTGIGKFVCWMKPVRAIDYYRHRIAKLKDKKEREKEKALASPQGMAFVGFRQDFDLFSVCKRYLLFCGRPKSTESNLLAKNKWRVSRAPAPSDVNWANIRTSKWRIILWYLRWSIVNLGILILLIFFTTPSAMFYILNKILGSTGLSSNMTAGSDPDSETGGLNNLIENIFGRFGHSDNTAFDAIKSLSLAYAGPLLLVLFSSLIPTIVSYASYLEFHWTKSDTMRATILKTYSFLLLMLLIFPSFSFTSFNILFDLIIEKKHTNNNSLTGFTSVTTIAFAPNTGIYFMDLLVISSFFALIQMFQIPALLIYLYRKLSARNEVETKRTHDGYKYIFEFGTEYAWVLVKISIAIVYGTLFPLITLSGLLYLMMKMAVDRYNLIYQARRVQEFSGSISVHLRAISFLYVSLFLSQLYILFLSIILYKYKSVRLDILVFNSCATILSLLILTSIFGFRWFQTYIHDFRYSLKNIMTRSQENLVEADRFIDQDEKYVYDYFDFIQMDMAEVVDDDEGRVRIDT